MRWSQAKPMSRKSVEPLNAVLRVCLMCDIRGRPAACPLFRVLMHTSFLYVHGAGVSSCGGAEHRVPADQMQTSDVVVSKTMPKMPSLRVRDDHVPRRPILPNEMCVEDVSTSHTEAHSENDGHPVTIDERVREHKCECGACNISIHTRTCMTCTQNNMWPHRRHARVNTHTT